MTKQRLISDARRRARTLSVETGRPYQSYLDEVARLAGRADWKAFVADPAVIPEQAIDEDGKARPEAGRGGRTRLACIAGAVMAAAIPVAAAAAILIDSDRMNEQSARVAAESTMLSHVHPPFVEDAGPRTVPARIEILKGGRRLVTLGILDMRVAGTSRFLRYLPGHEPFLFVGSDLADRRMRDELFKGSVMRLVMAVDCKASTARYLRYEAARNMTSTATFAKTIRQPAHARRIASATAAREVCAAPETPTIKIY